jgi:type II secretory pathway pseudopilin PulG
MKHSERGATLVEVLVAIGLTAIMLPTLATALITSHAGHATAQRQLRATALLREASEAVRATRSQNWNNIAVNGTYHPTIGSTDWVLASGPETVDGFTRQLVISDAQRNTSGILVTQNDIADPDTKHIVVTVSWSTPYSGSVTADLYLTHRQNEISWTWRNNATLATSAQRKYSI